MRKGRTIVSLLAALLTLALAAEARADEMTMLESGINSYEAARYEECTERFRAMLTPGSPVAIKERSLVNRARMYFGACLIAVSRDPDADRQMEQLILDDPRYFPDRAAFPAKVVDRFTEIRGRLKAEIDRIEQERLAAEAAERRRIEEQRRREAARLATLDRLAREEYVSKENSRWVAAIPFGVGQFQNGQNVLGWVFAGAETALVGTTVGTAIWKDYIERQYFDGITGRGEQKDRAAAESDRDTAILANRLAFGGLIAVAAAGVIHAQATFVPEVRERKERKLPEWLDTPTVSVTPAGATIGVGGSF